MPIGRPSGYSQGIADAICERIAAGSNLTEICRADEFPTRETIYQWLSKYASFADSYARATRLRADVWAEQIIEISEASEHADGPVAVNAARLRVDSRKWLMARLHPRKYGDKLELAGDKDAPLTVQVIRYTDESK